MAVDIVAGGRARKNGRTEYKGTDNYRGLLSKLYEFLERKVSSPFNVRVAKALRAPRRVRAQMSVSRVGMHMQKQEADRIAVIVGSVVDDTRLVPQGSVTGSGRVYTLGPLNVCALRFTRGARERIEKAGGRCLTFDELAREHAKGDRCILLRAQTSVRETERYFGPAPGLPHSHTKPRVQAKGRKFEMARGKRASRGYKK